MNTNEMIMGIAVTFIAVGIPLSGLVIRYALRPLIQDIASAIRGREEDASGALLHRLDRIEARLEEQTQQTGELLEAQRFYKELEAGKAEQSHQSSTD